MSSNTFSPSLWNECQNTVQELMKQIVLATVIAVLPAVSFAAEPNGKSAKKPADTKGQASTKSQAKPCSEYGEGYVKLEGSSTCVKVSGYVRFQAGAGWGR